MSKVKIKPEWVSPDGVWEIRACGPIPEGWIAYITNTEINEMVQYMYYFEGEVTFIPSLQIPSYVLDTVHSFWKRSGWGKYESF